MKFATIPDWAMPTKPDTLALFEAVALADLEDQWIRLDATTQRALIGFPVFGKQEFQISKAGELRISRQTCFGADSEVAEYSLARVSKAASARLKLSPGTFGPGYLS